MVVLPFFAIAFLFELFGGRCIFLVCLGSLFWCLFLIIYIIYIYIISCLRLL